MKRREFLVQTGAFTLLAGAGGLNIVNAKLAHPDRFVSPDAVLSIGVDGKVVFTSPYTEMGQGSPTAASMIMADELDTNLDQLELRNHDGRIALTDPTFRPRFNGGGSGGSQSMATAWTSIREIAATARTTLIEAAAIAWSVDASECDTSGDCVVHEASGRRLSYAELAGSAANIPLSKKPRYRSADHYRYIGKGRSRPDMRQILTGRAAFAIDRLTGGILFASIERCPYRKGSLLGFDRDRAMAVAGVIDVFEIRPGAVENRAKTGIVVVAQDTWSAMQGRKQLKAQWKNKEPLYADESEFWQAMENQLVSGVANGVHTVGDFEGTDLSGLQEFTQTYRLPYQNQTPMEPIAMTAHHKGDSFELWTSSQYVTDYRERIAEMTGLAQDDISVHNTIMGGSFGRRFVRDGLTEAIMIADRLRKPVKLVWTREDDIGHGQYRHASLMRVQAHLDDRGQLRRWYQKAVQTTIDDPGKLDSLGSGMSDQAYRFEPARFEMTGLKSNLNPGPMRSPPHPAKLFPTMCFIDELATRLGEDTINLHNRLIGASRDIPQPEWLMNHGHVDNTATHKEVANAVRKLSNWDAPLPKGHGKGFAMGYFFGTHLAMVVEVAWRNKMISIEKVWCSVNCGRVINPDIARQQVEGGAIYGLSAAMGETITTFDGAVQQNNFNDYPIMRLAQSPDIEVEFIRSDERPSGLGEPATPPAYPALANAIFAASGQRIREIPLNRHIQFAPSRSFS